MPNEDSLRVHSREDTAGSQYFRSGSKYTQLLEVGVSKVKSHIPLKHLTEFLEPKPSNPSPIRDAIDARKITPEEAAWSGSQLRPETAWYTSTTYGRRWQTAGSAIRKRSST